MSSQVGTTGKSLIDSGSGLDETTRQDFDRYNDKGWHESPERRKGFIDWMMGFGPHDESFDQSAEFRNARRAYRKRINGSWDMEST